MANGCNVLPGIGKPGETCCDLHDKAYVKGEFGAKIAGDIALTFCIIRANWMLTPVALLMFLLLMTFGWLWWSRYLLRRLFGWFPKKDD